MKGGVRACELSEDNDKFDEFSGYARNFQTDYALLPLEEKEEVKNT